MKMELKWLIVSNACKLKYLVNPLGATRRVEDKNKIL